jgi:hypothetical protein
MKENNVGKKDPRPINQLLDKQAREGRQAIGDVESRTIPKQPNSRNKRANK